MAASSPPQLPIISIIITLTLISLIPFSSSLPFIVLHGIGDKCSNGGISQFIELLGTWSGSKGYCLWEVPHATVFSDFPSHSCGSWDSWFTPLMDQTQIVCEKVKEMKELSDGYNIVGLSQGNIIGRAVIELCDGGPPVKNFISIGGPHAGTASIPFCGDHLAPSGYLKIPTFEHDTILIPKETAWFGYYPDCAFEPVLPPQRTPLYTEDWIGLKTFDDAGKVKYVGVPGNHLHISRSGMKEYVVPYLKTQTQIKTMLGNHLSNFFSRSKIS